MRQLDVWPRRHSAMVQPEAGDVAREIGRAKEVPPKGAQRLVYFPLTTTYHGRPLSDDYWGWRNFGCGCRSVQ